MFELKWKFHAEVKLDVGRQSVCLNKSSIFKSAEKLDLKKFRNQSADFEQDYVTQKVNMCSNHHLLIW